VFCTLSHVQIHKEMCVLHTFACANAHGNVCFAHFCMCKCTRKCVFADKHFCCAFVATPASGGLQIVLQLIKKGELSGGLMIDCSNRFYTLIPHDYGMQQPPLLDNGDIIKAKVYRSFLNMKSQNTETRDQCVMPKKKFFYFLVVRFSDVSRVVPGSG